MIVSEYLQGKMGKREFGKLLDRAAKITVSEKAAAKFAAKAAAKRKRRGRGTL